MPMLAEPLCGQLAVFTEGGDELGGFFGRDLRPEPCGAASRPDEMAIEVHDLGLVEAVHRVVLGIDDAGEPSTNLVIRLFMTLSSGLRDRCRPAGGRQIGRSGSYALFPALQAGVALKESKQPL